MAFNYCRALNVRSRPLSSQSTVLDNARDHMLFARKKNKDFYMTTAQPLLFKFPDRSKDAPYTSKLTPTYSSQRLSTRRDGSVVLDTYGTDSITAHGCRADNPTLLRVGVAWLGPSSRDWGSRSAAGLQVDSACPRRLGQPLKTPSPHFNCMPSLEALVRDLTSLCCTIPTKTSRCYRARDLLSIADPS